MAGKRIRIVSTDGTALSTKVFCADEELGHISGINIDHLYPDGVIEATITFSSVEIDIEAIQKQQ